MPSGDGRRRHRRFDRAHTGPDRHCTHHGIPARTRTHLLDARTHVPEGHRQGPGHIAKFARSTSSAEAPRDHWDRGEYVAFQGNLNATYNQNASQLAKADDLHHALTPANHKVRVAAVADMSQLGPRPDKGTLGGHCPPARGGNGSYSDANHVNGPFRSSQRSASAG